MSITLDPKAGVYILPDRLQLFLVLILFPYFPLYLFYLFPDSPIICPEGLHYPKSNLCCRMFSLSVQTFIINNFIFLLRIICLAVVEVGVHSLLHCWSSRYTTIILYVQLRSIFRFYVEARVAIYQGKPTYDIQYTNIMKGRGKRLSNDPIYIVSYYKKWA